MRAKAWAFANGHIKSDGRGRMPLVSLKDGRELSTVLMEAKKSGVTFSDWPKGAVVELAGTEDAAPSVKIVRTESDPNSVAELAPYRYTEEEFVAIEIRKGKRVERSLREACRGCRVSLVVCYCPQPLIVAHDGSGSVHVTIERR